MPQEAPEGILLASKYFMGGTGIDTSAIYGPDNKGTEVISLSKSKIETVDMLTEGPMDGPVSGIYTYSGILGEVGWRNVTFSGYSVPSAQYTGYGFLRSVYWNEIPVLSDDSQFNFQNVNVKYTNGLPNGEVLQTLSPFQTVSRTLGERLLGGSNNARVYRILNKDCRGVVVNVKFPQLASYTDTGDVGRTLVTYNISYRPIYVNKSTSNFIVSKTETIFGKIVASNGYIRSTRIDFSSNYLNDKSFIGWEIKVERTTPDTANSKVRNITYMDSLTEIQGNIYTFPNSAMIRSLFDAEFFANIPERAVDTKLLKVKIPGNYNPITKTYNTTGFATTNSGWNGEFATGKFWTDNPAWCYYDLLTNKRYGLGKFVNPDYIDKASLYEIGRYCDTLVSDGYGGLEPRFTCNTWIASREEAYKVINDMASVFLGMTYYSNGLIYASQDSPKEPRLSFTNANVEDGNFTYSTTSLKNRNSVAIVRYNDPKNFYKPSIEYVEDFDSIRRYGVREAELTAFGCASRGQAIRLGRWALLSDKLQPESINFVTSIGEASLLRPGDVFKVHDYNRKIKRYAGRTVNVANIGSTGALAILDSKVELEPNIEYKLSFVTPSYIYNSSQISGLNSNDLIGVNKSFLQTFNLSGFQTSVSGNRMVVNLYSGFNMSDYNVTGNQIWMLELSDKYSSYSGNRYFANSSEDFYSVINISEKEPHRFVVEGIQYNPNKYLEIESGLLFTSTQLRQSKVPNSPSNLNLNVFNISSNTKVISYSFLGGNTVNTTSFKVYSKIGQFPNNSVPDNSYLINVLPSYQTNGQMNAVGTGDFHFRVYAANDESNLLSPNFTSGFTTIYSYDPIRDVTIGGLTVDNITGLYSGGAANGYLNILTDNDANPLFRWQVGSRNQFINTGTLYYRVTVRNEVGTSRVPLAPIVYQETGLTDTNWTYTLAKNIASSGGPYRDYKVTVEAHNSLGRTSAGNKINTIEDAWLNNPFGYDVIAISNPVVTGIELKNQVLTQLSGDGDFYTGNLGYYDNYAYIGPNGNLTVQFTSGRFESDIVGGFFYTCTGQFPKSEALANTGWNGLDIRRTRFDFNPILGTAYSPTAAINLIGQPTGFLSISFYDDIDYELLKKGINISTGLFLSNNAVIYNQSIISDLTIGGQQLKVLRVRDDGGGGGGYGGEPIDHDNAVIIGSGYANGISTVIYMYPGSGLQVNW